MLGGRHRESVPAYATGHFFRDADSIEELESIVAEEARSHVENGFTALKQKIGLGRHFPWGPEEDLRLDAVLRGEAERVPAYVGGSGYVHGTFDGHGRTRDTKVIWPATDE